MKFHDPDHAGNHPGQAAPVNMPLPAVGDTTHGGGHPCPRPGPLDIGPRQFATGLFLLIACLFLLTGCVKLALRASPSLIDSLTKSIFAECDPQLAAAAIPSDLKLLEGLLREDSSNSTLLQALCRGFSGYALLFVEPDDPERASGLYLRARNYGLRALGATERLVGPGAGDRHGVEEWLQALPQDRVEPLFWTVLAWSAWLRNNLDKPSALAQIGTLERCLDHVIKNKPGLLYGAPLIVKGVLLAARPRMLGGNLNQARTCFEEALRLSGRRFLLAQYYFARYYAVASQEKDLFYSLAEEITSRSPEEPADVCLINTVIRRWAPGLRERADEWFY